MSPAPSLATFTARRGDHHRAASRDVAVLVAGRATRAGLPDARDSHPDRGNRRLHRRRFARARRIAEHHHRCTPPAQRLLATRQTNQSPVPSPWLPLANSERRAREQRGLAQTHRRSGRTGRAGSVVPGRNARAAPGGFCHRSRHRAFCAQVRCPCRSITVSRVPGGGIGRIGYVGVDRVARQACHVTFIRMTARICVSDAKILLPMQFMYFNGATMRPIRYKRA